MYPQQNGLAQKRSKLLPFFQGFLQRNEQSSAEGGRVRTSTHVRTTHQCSTPRTLRLMTHGLQLSTTHTSGYIYSQIAQHVLRWLYCIHIKFSVRLALRHAERFVEGGPFLCHFLLGKQKKVESSRSDNTTNLQSRKHSEKKVKSTRAKAHKHHQIS